MPPPDDQDAAHAAVLSPGIEWWWCSLDFFGRSTGLRARSLPSPERRLRSGWRHAQWRLSRLDLHDYRWSVALALFPSRRRYL